MLYGESCMLKTSKGKRQSAIDFLSLFKWAWIYVVLFLHWIPQYFCSLTEQRGFISIFFSVQCSIPGLCIGGTFEGATSVKNEQECIDACKKDDNCNWYTYSPTMAGDSWGVFVSVSQGLWMELSLLLILLRNMSEMRWRLWFPFFNTVQMVLTNDPKLMSKSKENWKICVPWDPGSYKSTQIAASATTAPQD